MYTTKVNVNDLVIDMPLDEANVAQKMESLKAGGLVQPVTVWLQDFRIIDGFHRTEAAKRLGWTEIDCVVKDCDEETFWDARIQSARQHHSVEEKRLLAWVFECWKQTEWYIEADGNENLIRQIAQVLWNVAKEEGKWDEFYLSGIKHPVIEWVVSKSKAWKYPEWELCKTLLNGTNRGERWTLDLANRIAADLKMDGETRLDFIGKVQFQKLHDTRWRGGITDEDLEEYAQHFIGVPETQRKSISEFVNERIKHEEDERLNQLIEVQRQNVDETRRYLQWGKSEEGKRAKRQQVKSDFSVKVSALRAHVADSRADFAQLDDGYEMLISLSAWAATKAAELFPEREQPTEVQLRRELADAYRQIQSLQKALDSRKDYRPRLPEVLAYSSTEISKANQL